MKKILFKEIKVSNTLLHDLANYAFRNFPNEEIEIPLDISENEKILDIIPKGIPFIKFYADNSTNSIDFYFNSISSVERVKFLNLRMITNHFIYSDNKYTFY